MDVAASTVTSSPSEVAALCDVRVVQRRTVQRRLWGGDAGADEPPQRCRVRLAMLVDRDLDARRAQWDKNLEITTNIIVSEDLAAAQSIQRALQGGAAPPEFVFGRKEAPLQHYHQQLQAALDGRGWPHRTP